MRTKLNFVDDENTLFDLIKSRKQFNNIVVTCRHINVFGPMYCRTERNEIVEVEGRVNYEVTYPIMDKEDGRAIHYQRHYFTNGPLKSRQEVSDELYAIADICNVEDLVLHKLLTFDGKAYMLHEIYLDYRTGKFYDILLEDCDNYAYLINSDDI